MSSNRASVRDPREVAERAIVFRTRGVKHGPITRLVSPSDVGEMIKPFIFLDLINVPVDMAPRFNWHPHSGIATLTLMLKGIALYEETTGVKGTLTAGAVEWMQAGGGVWHTGDVGKEEAMKGFQLWVALPPELENAPAQSCYLNSDEVPTEGPRSRHSRALRQRGESHPRSRGDDVPRCSP